MDMQEVMTKERIKDRLSIKDKTKKILIGGVIVVVAVGGTIVLYKLRCVKLENAKLIAENAKLLAENAELIVENGRLKELCLVKDGHFIEVISDSLRHGSSLGAKHMADLRWLQVA